MIFSKLIDDEGRRLNYLRISITDRCNLSCIYCTPDERILMLKHDDVLRYEEILRLVKIGVSLGITKVRITGGEPLVRKGIFEFIENLSRITELEDISLTTNGVLLLENAEKIKNAGVTRINVSLDSLMVRKYKRITGCDKLQKVWSGILYAHELGFEPIKMNVVAMRGINDDEFIDFARLSFLYPFQIRFIEYMPVGVNRVRAEYQILTSEIKSKLSNIGKLKPVEREENDGPAKRFKFEGALGELGFISALSDHFCDNCNRLRLTADGHLRSCLLSNESLSLKKIIRSGCSNHDLYEAFLKSVRNKNARHSLTTNTSEIVRGQMCNIGG